MRVLSLMVLLTVWSASHAATVATSSQAQYSKSDFGASEVRYENLNLSIDDDLGLTRISGTSGYLIYAPEGENNSSQPLYVRVSGGATLRTETSAFSAELISYYPESGVAYFGGEVNVSLLAVKSITTLYCRNGVLYVNGKSKGYRTISNPYQVGNLLFWCGGSSGNDLGSRQQIVP